MAQWVNLVLTANQLEHKVDETVQLLNNACVSGDILWTSSLERFTAKVPTLLPAIAEALYDAVVEHRKGEVSFSASLC